MGAFTWSSCALIGFDQCWLLNAVSHGLILLFLQWFFVFSHCANFWLPSLNHCRAIGLQFAESAFVHHQLAALDASGWPQRQLHNHSDWTKIQILEWPWHGVGIGRVRCLDVHPIKSKSYNFNKWCPVKQPAVIMEGLLHFLCFSKAPTQ